MVDTLEQFLIGCFGVNYVNGTLVSKLHVSYVDITFYSAFLSFNVGTKLDSKLFASNVGMLIEILIGISVTEA